MKFIDKYNNPEIRALSWKQPFASLMLHGKSETRVWNTKYRGWVLICASKGAYSFKQALEISGQEQFDRIFKTINGAEGGRPLPLGQAIAIGYLSSVKFMGDYIGNKPVQKEIENKCFVEYNPELWIHEYTDVQPIVPFEWKGSQGWRTLDQETKDKIILL